MRVARSKRLAKISDSESDEKASSSKTWLEKVHVRGRSYQPLGDSSSDTDAEEFTGEMSGFIVTDDSQAVKAEPTQEETESSESDSASSDSAPEPNRHSVSILSQLAPELVNDLKNRDRIRG